MCLFRVVFQSTVAPTEHRLPSRPSGPCTADLLSYLLSIFLSFLVDDCVILRSFCARWLRAAEQGCCVRTPRDGRELVSEAPMCDSSSWEGNGAMKSCCDRVFQAVRERWRFGARSMFSGWSHRILLIEKGPPFSLFNVTIWLHVSLYLYISTLWSLLNNNCNHYNPHFAPFFLDLFYFLHPVTHGRRSSRLQWGSTRTQWTQTWSGWTFWSATLTKGAACTATDSSAQSGASRPSCERSASNAPLTRQKYYFAFVCGLSGAAEAPRYGGFLCGHAVIYGVCDVFPDSGDQSDGDIREGTLYRRPRAETDGAVLDKCTHLVLPYISWDAVGDAAVSRGT